MQEAEEKAEREAEKEKAEKEKGEKFASGKPKKGRVATEDDLFAEVDKDDEKEDEKKDDDKKVTPRCFSAPQHPVLLGLSVRENSDRSALSRQHLLVNIESAA